MSRIGNIIRQAHRQSLRGRHKDCLVGAILMKGGNVLDRASNLSRAYGEKNRGFHAEERLLKKYRDCTGCTLVVVRSNRNGKLSTMSRPCAKCWPLVVSRNIKKVVYVDWNGSIVTERVNYVQY